MLFITESINSKSWEDSWCILCAQFWSVMHSFWLFKSLRTHSTQFIYTFTVKVQTYHDVHPFYCIALFFQTQMKKWIPLNAWRNLHISLTEARWQWTPNPVAVTLHCHRHRINTAFYHPLLYCCFSPPIGLSSLLFQLFCVEGGVIWHSQLLEVLIKPGLLQERGWMCLLGLLIALAGWNPFHSSWNVNCPFPFPSDQGGNHKTNCRPVILSTQGHVSQKTALTFGWVFSR